MSDIRATTLFSCPLCTYRGEIESRAEPEFVDPKFLVQVISTVLHELHGSHCCHSKKLSELERLRFHWQGGRPAG
jgi:hypothetical protein